VLLKACVLIAGNRERLLHLIFKSGTEETPQFSPWTTTFSALPYSSQKALIREHAPRAKDFTNQRVRKGGEVDADEQRRNRTKSKVRARVDHVFAVIKRLWGFAKGCGNFLYAQPSAHASKP
jgi:hypothetical protein